MTKEQPLIQFANRSALVVMVLGLVVMAGWIFGIETLTRLSPHFETMKFTTASGFFLSGAALWQRHQRTLRLTLGVIVLVLGVLSLLEYLMKADFGIDQLLINDRYSHSVFPGRMSQITAIVFLCSGSVILSINSPNKVVNKSVELLALSITIFGIVALMGYALSVKHLYLVPGFSTVSILSSLSFSLLGLSLLSVMPESLLHLMFKTRHSYRNFWAGFSFLFLLLFGTGVFIMSSLNRIEFEYISPVLVDNPIVNITISNLINDLSDFKGSLFSLLVLSVILSLGIADMMIRALLESETTLRLKKRELQKSESRLSRFYNSDMLGATFWDKSGEICDANDKFLAMFGYSRDDLLSGRLDWKKMTPPEYQYLDSIALFQLKTTGVSAPFEKVYLKKDGTPVPILITGAMLEDGSDEGIAIVLDISERKQMERVLKESETRFQTLADHAPVLIWLNNDQGRQFVNRPYREFVGSDEPSDWLGYNWLNYIHPDDRDGYLNAYHIAFENRKPFISQFRFRHHKEGYKQMKSSALPHYSNDGAFLGYVGCTFDITDLKQTEFALLQRQKDLDLAQEVGRIGSWRMNVRSKELTWSAEHYRLFGVPQNKPLSYSSFLKSVHPDDRQFVEAKWKAALQGEPYELEHRIIINKQVKWIHEKASLEFDEAGELLEGFGITQDITERKQIEAALREADRRKDEFLAMLGHELRNPLAPILTMAQLLDEGNLNTAMHKKATGVILRNAAQLSHLVNDLLNISRVTQGQISLQPTSIDVLVILREALEMVQSQFQSKQQSLHIQLPDKPVYINADPVRLNQVFSNLLVNASKFTPEEGLIMVTVELEEPFVAVYIRDNGAGISADLLPYIFEVFTQGERTLAREEGGLGIGLALVKSLVELHGGQVSAISQGINQGAEFVVKLPIIQTPMHSKSENQQIAPEKNDLPLRILLIDDNEDSIAGSALYFKMIGHQVETALNGMQGLAAALSFNPEVVLLDIGLPDMDGYQVAHQLRKQADGRPVLLMALSGYAPDRNSQSFKEANFDHYLIKPFDLNKLQTLLADYQRLKRTGNLSMP